jgi:MFS family permease
MTYQAFYLLDKIGVAEADLPEQVFVATLASSAFWVVPSLAGGRLSDVLRRRKPFVLAAAVIYSIGLVLVAFSEEMTPFLVAMGAGDYSVFSTSPRPSPCSARSRSCVCGECAEQWGRAGPGAFRWDGPPRAPRP